MSKFKVGDKVRILSCSLFGKYNVGKVSTVKSIGSGGYTLTGVDNISCCFYTEEELGLIQEYRGPIGTKNDQGKPRYSLLVQEYIDELIEVLEFGAKNHGDFNWQNVDPVRFQDALYRHYSKYVKGELHDEETGKQHMAHIAANAQFLFWLNSKGGKND